MNVKELEEFQYNFGDPRPYFFRYVERFPNVSSVLPKKRVAKFRIASKDCVRFRCNALNKRNLELPANFASLFEKATNPIVMIPIYLINKNSCRNADRSRHLIFLLYNRVTKELERIDMKRYHLAGFGQKLLIKKIEAQLMAEYFQDDEYVTELDVPFTFVKKHGFTTLADAFPIYALSYLTIRTRDPTLKASQAKKLTNGLGKRVVSDIWKKYIEYRQEFKSKCQDGMIENIASSRCVLPLSKSIQKYAIEQSPKPCVDGKVYSPLLTRCVKKEKLADVNVFLEDVMKVKVPEKNKLQNLDKDPVVSISIMNFILSKFPHGRFVVPDSNKKIAKKDFKVTWRYNKEKDDFILSIPASFWEIWQKHMFDASCRFIIAFVGLVSKSTETTSTGFHANVLIYDKDTNELERFDGLGRDLHSLYNITGFDKLIVEEFNKKNDIFKKPVRYFTPLDYCPKMPVFQRKEIDDIPGKDLSGNCAVWRIFYVHLRLANPHLNRKDLVIMASNKLSKTGSLYNFIKAYQAYLLQSYKNFK